MQPFSAVAKIYFFLSLSFFAHKKFKNPPTKVAKKNSNPLFFLLPELPKQKDLCSKMWPTDQLYIELGIELYICWPFYTSYMNFKAV